LVQSRLSFQEDHCDQNVREMKQSCNTDKLEKVKCSERVTVRSDSVNKQEKGVFNTLFLIPSPKPLLQCPPSEEILYR